MSSITDVLVHGADQKSVDALNVWLLEHDTARHQQLERIDMEHAGGTKIYCPRVFAAAFNCVPAEFLDKLREPSTWGFYVLSTLVFLGLEEGGDEVFMFDTDHADRVYRKTVKQVWGA
jgi:hypothetical protein